MRRWAEQLAALRTLLRLTVNCWGFLGSTFRRIISPGDDRERYRMYNRQKGACGVKYLVVSSACGLVEHVAGPFAGRELDSALCDSSILEELASYSFVEEEKAKEGEGDGRVVPCWIYGKAAVPPSEHYHRPIAHAVLYPEETACNNAWESVRVSVDQVEEDLAATWPRAHFQPGKEERVALWDLTTTYQVSVLLYNALTCVRRGNRASHLFHVRPPTLEDWLHPRLRRRWRATTEFVALEGNGGRLMGRGFIHSSGQTRE